jgi:hypothetical protein
MYAKNSQTDIYHFLTDSEEQTLCGLTVIPIIINKPIKSDAIHLTSRQPPGQRICEECVTAKRGFDNGSQGGIRPIS